MARGLILCFPERGQQLDFSEGHLRVVQYMLAHLYHTLPQDRRELLQDLRCLATTVTLLSDSIRMDTLPRWPGTGSSVLALVLPDRAPCSGSVWGNTLVYPPSLTTVWDVLGDVRLGLEKVRSYADVFQATSELSCVWRTVAAAAADVESCLELHGIFVDAS